MYLVVLRLDSSDVCLNAATEFLCHNTTIVILSLFKSIEGFNTNY